MYYMESIMHFRFCLYMIKLNINWICMYLNKRRYSVSFAVQCACACDALLCTVLCCVLDSYVCQFTGQTATERFLCIYLIYLQSTILLMLRWPRRWPALCMHNIGKYTKSVKTKTKALAKCLYRIRCRAIRYSYLW